MRFSLWLLYRKLSGNLICVCMGPVPPLLLHEAEIELFKFSKKADYTGSCYIAQKIHLYKATYLHVYVFHFDIWIFNKMIILNIECDICDVTDFACDYVCNNTPVPDINGHRHQWSTYNVQEPSYGAHACSIVPLSFTVWSRHEVLAYHSIRFLYRRNFEYSERP